MQAAPAAETDPCAACGGLLLDRPAAFKARAGSKTIAVLGTPARVCGGCGRVFYAPAVEQRLKAIVEAHKADHGQQVFVDWPG